MTNQPIEAAKNRQRLSSQLLRKIVIQQSYRGRVGHIGSNLSVIELLAAVYATINIPEARHPDRDRFVLSKGHSALALYAVLCAQGWITAEELESFSTDGTLLGVHPEHRLPGIDFCSGSLGQGFTYAVGAALAARMQNSKRRVFVLVSDAECNEGVVWEAAAFAAHHRLSNLILLIDLNGQQALDYTENVLAMAPMAERWKAFGWDTHRVDGHNVEELVASIEALDTDAGAPHALVANTISGKGVSFMERQIAWHYLPLSDEQYCQALAEIEAGER